MLKALRKKIETQKMLRKNFLILAFSIIASVSFALPKTEDLEKIAAQNRARVGVAILPEEEEAILLNNDERYPLMSVFKLHVAIAVLKKIENENLDLSEKIFVSEKDISKNTYSPLLKKYPNGNFEISIGETIAYAISLSDNNACDILINFAGGIKKVESFIKSLGIEDLELCETESSMHSDILNSYNNWASPLSVVNLLKKVYTESILSEAHLNFLKKVLADTSTGSDKLRAGLPSNTRLEHKTGHSDRTKSGLQIADNDAGVFYLPNGKACYISVFVKDSHESDARNAKIIADIAKLTYDSLFGKKENGQAR